MSERLTTERVRAIADEPPDVLTDTGMSGGISSILAARYLRHNLAADLLDAREQLAAQADELARLASERDAAVLRATALADAVRRERETHRALRLARTRYIRSQVGESEREEHDARQAHYEADEAARDATADLDALLAGHADPYLRTRVHDAFARKEERRRSALEGAEGAVQ